MTNEPGEDELDKAVDELLSIAEGNTYGIDDPPSSFSLDRGGAWEIEVDSFKREVRAFLQSLLAQTAAAARLETIDKVYELSPTATFDKWSPHEAFIFYERLKAYEAELRSEEGNKDA